jgi:cysteine desulfurase
MHYFDYAAATPISPIVRAAMEPYFSDEFYNPSAQYLAAQKVHKAVEKARADVAGIMGVRPQEITFTAGGTEANNLAIAGVMARNPDGNCIVSAIEHDSVLEPAAKYNYKIAPVNSDGRINLDELEKLIDDKTVLVSVAYANNEIGTIQPLSEISKLIKSINQKIIFHTDACQAPNYLQVLPNTLGVDMMTLNGGKIYGPKQSGALFVKTGIELEPLIYGGGQEKKLRSGTENVAGIIGFAAALKEADSLRTTESKRLRLLQQKAYEFIDKTLQQAHINGSIDNRLPNNLHVSIPGIDNERIMMMLDELGFMVAVGSACSASSDEPSHVLKAIGLSDEDARSSLRITMGRDTTEEALAKLLSTLAKII